MNYLQLTAAGLKCLLPLAVVEEIFSLPELAIVPDAPPDILGVLNLRGDLVPILHLGSRLGIAPPQCRDTDTVVLLTAAGLRVGLVVQQVEDVVTEVALCSEPDYGHLSPLNTAFVAGLAQVATELLVLINLETLIRAPVAVAQLTADLAVADLTTQSSYDFYDRYWPTATPAQRSLLRERQQHLCQAQETAARVEDTLTVAVFELAGEQFAIPLTEIRQFIEVNRVVPIPTAPQLIVGHLSLQGEVIPLIDIREPLRLGRSPVPLRKAVVLEVDTAVVAILIQDIRGIMTYHYRQLQLSSFLSAHDNGHIGSLIQEGQVIKLLNISQLVSKTIALATAA